MKRAIKEDSVSIEEGTPQVIDRCRDLFDVMEERYECASTLFAAQLPMKHGHEIIADPTLSDAILDRLVHNAVSQKAHK